MAAMDLEAYNDLDRAIEQLLQCKPLSEAEVKELCAKAQNVFVNENNVQPVAAPVTVSGAVLPPPRAAAVRPLPATAGFAPAAATIAVTWLCSAMGKG